jgi:ABC-type multidrug transport system ATPase subunit
MQIVGRCVQRAGRNRVAALDDVSATFPAGSSTVILAAPGSGSSTLLRVVSGRARATPSSSVTWAGADASSLKAKGVSISRLAAYCREADEHEAHLTVRETLRFAHTSSVVLPDDIASSATTSGVHVGYALPSAEDIVAAMGLTAAGNTIAGGMLAR